MVVAEGPADAPLVIIGEGPGRTEDQAGRPFAGPAGQLLDRILHAAGLRRAETYLTNTVKCRPPGRDPTPQEILTCTDHWLHPQLSLLRPRVIVTLGNTPTQTLLRTTRGITDLRGHWYAFTHPDAQSGQSQALLRPLYHPAYLLRRDERTPGSPKSLTWHDIQEVAAVLHGEREPAALLPVPLDEPGQPGLF